MGEIMNVQAIRLVGPDGSVGAILEARNNGAASIQLGNPMHDGGIMISSEEDGSCSITVAPFNGYSRVTIDAQHDIALISFRNAEDKVSIAVASTKDSSSVTLMDDRGRLKLSLSVELNGQVTIEEFREDGTRRRSI